MNSKGYNWKNYENEVGRIVEFCWFCRLVEVEKSYSTQFG